MKFDKERIREIVAARKKLTDYNDDELIKRLRKLVADHGEIEVACAMNIKITSLRFYIARKTVKFSVTKLMIAEKILNG